MNRECLFFVGKFPPIRVNSIGRLLYLVTAFERLVGRTLHRFLQLDVRFGSEKDVTHPSDNILQQCLHRG